MPFFAVDKELVFPPVHYAEPDGLLAMGGDLSPERLLLAYRSGIFPWYEGRDILWWSPDPRFVLLPSEIKISKSMKTLINKQAFAFTVNKAFSEVIFHCQQIRSDFSLSADQQARAERHLDHGRSARRLYDNAYPRICAQRRSMAERPIGRRIIRDPAGKGFLWRKHVQQNQQCQQICVYKVYRNASTGGRSTGRLPGIYRTPGKFGRENDLKRTVYSTA